MNIQRFLVERCDNDVGMFRQLIFARTGCALEWALIWKWCRTKRPRPLGYKYARLVTDATEGVITLDELQDPELVARDFVHVPGPRQLAEIEPSARARLVSKIDTKLGVDKRVRKKARATKDEDKRREVAAALRVASRRTREQKEASPARPRRRSRAAA